MVVYQARCPCEEATAQEGGPNALQLRLRQVQAPLETGTVQTEGVGRPCHQLQCTCTQNLRYAEGVVGMICSAVDSH